MVNIAQQISSSLWMRPQPPRTGSFKFTPAQLAAANKQGHDPTDEEKLLASPNNSWATLDPRIILDNHGQSYPGDAAASELVGRLKILVEKHDLTSEDLHRFQEAHQEKRALPACKPPVPTDCTLCLEMVDAGGFPTRRITPSCTHDANVCLTCLSQSLSIQSTTKLWDHIDCPHCGERLTFKTCKTWPTPTPLRGKSKWPRRNENATPSAQPLT